MNASKLIHATADVTENPLHTLCGLKLDKYVSQTERDLVFSIPYFVQCIQNNQSNAWGEDDCCSDCYKHPETQLKLLATCF